MFSTYSGFLCFWKEKTLLLSGVESLIHYVEVRLLCCLVNRLDARPGRQARDSFTSAEHQCGAESQGCGCPMAGVSSWFCGYSPLIAVTTLLLALLSFHPLFCLIDLL